MFDFSGYLLACAVLVWRVVLQAKAGEGCEAARSLGREQYSFARASREKTAMLRRLVYIWYLQRSSGFLFYVKFARKVFTNYLFFLHPDF